MMVKSDSVYSALIKTVVLILVLFLVSTPVFYLTISSDNIFIIYSYVIARILRFIVAIIISCVIRKKNRNILAQNVLLRKKIFKLLLGFIGVSTLLHIHNVYDDIYFSISYRIGIFNNETTPLFLRVLWEQLFLGDLYWSVLLGMSIVFFTCKQPLKKLKCGGTMHKEE